MSTADLPIPPEVFHDGAPPLTDEDLDRLFDTVDHLVADSYDRLPAEEALRGLAEGDDDPNHPAAQRTARWRVEDDRTAAWAAAKMAEAHREINRLAEQANEWSARIGAWFDQAARAHMRREAFMEAQLCAYALRCRAADPNRRTLVLPDATVKTTHSQPQVVVEDDATVALVLDTALGEPPPDADADTLAAYRAWRDAYEELLGEDDVVLVRREPKVYVKPLRKLVTVRPVIDEETGEILRHEAVGPDGAPVPGTAVKAEQTTANVTEVR